jgi:hypothetical protein
VRDLFFEWLDLHFPDRAQKVRHRIRELRGGRDNDPRFGHRMRGQGPWAELLQRSLPSADSPPDEQAAALSEWSQRLRLPLALDDRDGRRIVASESFQRREAEVASRREGPDGAPGRRGWPIRLEDGRTLWVMRPGLIRPPPGVREGAPPLPWFTLPGLRALPGSGLAVLLAVLFAAVATGAYPVVRHLTRRLENLKQGVEAFGGALRRV